MEKEIRAIKIWIAIGSIGFLLIGASAFVFSVSFYNAMTLAGEYQGEDVIETEHVDSFRDKVNNAFDRGDFETVLKLVDDREATYPYEADPKWFRAKVLVQQGKHDEAIQALDKVEVLAPNWTKDYVDPLKQIIERNSNLDKD